MPITWDTKPKVEPLKTTKATSSPVPPSGTIRWGADIKPALNTDIAPDFVSRAFLTPMQEQFIGGIENFKSGVSDIFGGPQISADRTTRNLPKPQLALEGVAQSLKAGEKGVAGLGKTVGGIVQAVTSPLAPIFAGASKIGEWIGNRDIFTSPTAQKVEKFLGENPSIGEQSQTILDISNLAVPEGARVAGPKVGALLDQTGNSFSKAREAVKVGGQEKTVSGVAEEIYNVENNYSKTRKANEFSTDAGAASRERIALSNALVDSVDENGLIRTKQPGGAVDKYKAQTVDGLEGIGRKVLEKEGATINIDEVAKLLRREIEASKLSPDELETALTTGINKQIAGLMRKADSSGNIKLVDIHDAKINTTNHIDYLTPAETKTYRKSVARAYKLAVEEKSNSSIKEINKELSTYLGDIERLENLDGRRVQGGKLGKYTAQIAGNVAGGMLGHVLGGPVGMVAGTVLGGEVSSAIKGKAMASSFGKDTGTVLPKSKVLEGAKAEATTPKPRDPSTPDPKVGVSKRVPKTDEVVRLEGEIAQNVEAQKRAIKVGDFELVAKLKEIYDILLQKLRAIIDKYEKLPNKQGGFARIKFSDAEYDRVAKALEKYDTTPVTVDGAPIIEKVDVEFRLEQLKTKLQRTSLSKDEIAEAKSLLEEVGAIDAGTSPDTKGGQSPQPKTEVSPSPNDTTASKDMQADTSAPFGGKTYYHTTTKKAANAIRSEGFKAQVGNRSLGTTKGKGVFLYEDIGPTKEFSKNFTRNGTEADVVETTINGKIFNSRSQSKSINALAEDEALIERLKKEGYVGIRGTEMDVPVTFVFDEKALNVSSPLLQEAKKYKTAEDFVKAQGTPVYHGTKHKFTAFEDKYLGQVTGSKSAKEGFYFTTNRDVAEGYARFGDSAKADALRVKAEAMEKIARRTGKNSDWEAYSKAYGKYEDAALTPTDYKDRQVIEARLNIKNPLIVDFGNKRFIDEDYMGLLQRAKQNGHDGLIIKNVSDAVETTYSLEYEPNKRLIGDIYIPFSSKQIKTRSQLLDLWKKANNK